MFIQFPEEIKRSYSKLLQSNPSTSPWVLYSLATKTNALVVSEEGSGIDPLLEEFEASKIQFGVACHSIHNLSKYVLICWCGEGVPVSGKSQFHTIVKDVTSFFQGIHVVIQARTEADLDYKAILKKLEDSAGAKYNESKNTSAPVNRPPPPVKSDAIKPTLISPPTAPSTGNPKPYAQAPVPQPKVAPQPSVTPSWKAPIAVEPKPVSAPAHEIISPPSRSVEKISAQFNDATQYDNSSFFKKSSGSVSNIAAAFNQAPSSSIDRIQQERERRLKEDQEAKERAHAEERARLTRTSQTERVTPKPVEPANDFSARFPPIPVPSSTFVSSIHQSKVQPDIERKKREELEQLEIAHREQQRQEELDRQRAQREREASEKQRKMEEEAAAAEMERLRLEAPLPAVSTSSGLTAVALYDYVPGDENEIPLNENETVTNIIQLDEGWWQGTNQSGQTGLFPANYVEILKDTVAPTAPVTQTSIVTSHVQPEHIQMASPVIAPPVETKSSAGVTAVALYDYDATEENELTLRAGDIITDVEMIADEWWQGKVSEAIGLFPANYVELQQ